jgi:hypothetical protein
MIKFLSNSKAFELLSEKGRELPASPAFFGILTFGILMFLLYLVMRLDKD